MSNQIQKVSFTFMKVLKVSRKKYDGGNFIPTLRQRLVREICP